MHGAGGEAVGLRRSEGGRGGGTQDRGKGQLLGSEMRALCGDCLSPIWRY